MAKDWFPNTNAGRKTVGADQTKVQFSGYWFRWLPVLLMVLLLLTTLGGIGTGIMETVGLLYWVSEWIGRGIYGVALALAWWWAHQYGPWKITARPGSLLLERGQRRWVIPWTEIEKVSATDDGVVLHQSRAPDLTLLAHQGKGTCRNVATDLNHLVDDFGGTQRAAPELTSRFVVPKTWRSALVLKRRTAFVGLPLLLLAWCLAMLTTLGAGQAMAEVFQASYWLHEMIGQLFYTACAIGIGAWWSQARHVSMTASDSGIHIVDDGAIHIPWNNITGMALSDDGKRLAILRRRQSDIEVLEGMSRAKLEEIRDAMPDWKAEPGSEDVPEELRAMRQRDAEHSV